MNLTNYNILLNLVNGLIKYGLYNRIIAAIREVAQIFEFDLEATRKLCSQLYRYKEQNTPFDIPYSNEDSPITWWESIEIEPNYLQRVALYILSICPNSASCERGFSTLGWLTGKRRQNLGVEKLESMTKLITYYKSNASKELAFYGKEMIESEIMETVQLALAEPIDDDYDDSTESIVERTISGEVIPEDNVRVVIEPLWLEKTLNLEHQIIIDSLGEIPFDDFEFIYDNENEYNENNEEENPNRQGIFDFTTEDLLAEFGKDT